MFNTLHDFLKNTYGKKMLVDLQKLFLVIFRVLEKITLKRNQDLEAPVSHSRNECCAYPTGPGGSRTAVASGIEHIWDKILTDELGIPRTSRSSHRVVLVTPDVYHRDDIRDIIHVLLVNLDFAAVFVAVQSVSSAFGASLSSACVVDVGAEKTVVACVDDGISIPGNDLINDFKQKSDENQKPLVLSFVTFLSENLLSVLYSAPFIFVNLCLRLF